MGLTFHSSTRPDGMVLNNNVVFTFYQYCLPAVCHMKNKDTRILLMAFHISCKSPLSINSVSKWYTLATEELAVSHLWPATAIISKSNHSQ